MRNLTKSVTLPTKILHKKETTNKEISDAVVKK